ncbi:MAG: class I SAM-dependent methyltransferase [Paludibacter sp.]
MKNIRYIYNYIYHFLTARNTKGYDVHSPFLFQLVRFVMYDKSPYYIFPEIEKLRQNLKNDKRILHVEDFGTSKSRDRKVSEICKHSLKQPKYAQLLFKLVNFSKAQKVLELGTSLGLTTSYLASPSSKIHCITLEGSIEIAAVAKENFKKLQIENIHIVTGNIDNSLIQVLNEFEQLDFVFIDANHRLPATYDYFEKCVTKIHDKSVIVIDDIYWSEDMKQAWRLIKSHPKVKSTFDLFHLGIVFFNPDINKTHYKMRY